MILAGDIGGTKTILSLLSRDSGGLLKTVKEEIYANRNFTDFDEILAIFLPADVKIGAACFGVAGPVVEQRCQTTNLPWLLDAELLKAKLGTEKVKLLNDLEAMALGMLYLPSTDLIELNPNAQTQRGNMAVIAAGTGLGEAVLFWDGANHHPMATEGGHSDFATLTDQQDRLLGFLRTIFPNHVSCENIIAGNGFGILYDFLIKENSAKPNPIVPDKNSEIDRNAVISRLGVTGEDPLCVAAVQLFVDLYGAETGNLALKSLATGGVFIGGGIAPKILPFMQDGRFLRAFKAKGRFQALLDKVSVKLSLNPRTPLIGAIHYFGQN